MKKHSASFFPGSALFSLLVFLMIAIAVLTSVLVSERRKSALQGTIAAGSAFSSNEPNSSLTELLKKFFGNNSPSSSSTFVNPDPTNDCGNTKNPYPQQCIAGQEHCCHGQWICPNVLGQYVCE